ncbi:MAG: hypothetical protein ACI8P2_001952 [Candidatus Latescibacterota bacterium]|jgi:hypothetical protein
MAVKLLYLTLLFSFLIPLNARALLGKALKLDGVQDYVEIEDATDLYMRDALTVSAWFRAESLKSGTDGWQALFWKGTSPDHSPYNMREFGLWLNESGLLEFDATPQGAKDSGWTRKISTEAGAVRAGQWYHVAVVMSAAESYMRIYLNGARVAEGPFASLGMRDTVGSLRIGGMDDRDYFSGVVDEVQIWNRALSLRDILLNMNRSLTGQEEGLVSYYAFDELDAEGFLPDDAENGHRGVLRGDAHLISIQVLMPPVAGVRVDSTAFADLALLGEKSSVNIGSIEGEGADLLVMALKHHDPGVRRRATKSLARVAPSDFTRVMRVALHSPDPVVRHQAVEILGERDFSALPTELKRVYVPERDIVIAGGEVVADSETMAVRSLSRDINGYSGWEQRWKEPQTVFWSHEPEGLMGRFNRVEGGYIGWLLPRAYHPGSGLANYGEIGYSSGRKEISYRAGAEFFSFYHSPNSNDNLVTIGAELHDEVDTQDGWLIAHEENSADALLFRRDFRDYYRHTGWSVYSTHNFGGVLQMTGRYGFEEFESLQTQTDEIFVGNRFARRAFRDNPAIEEGQIRSLSVSVQLDTRNRPNRPNRGFFANAIFERAGGFLGGDAGFKRYLGDIRRYQPVGRGTRLDLRLRLGTAKGPLPSQYAYDIGGLGSLRGYGFKEFSGDRMVLLNAEYWVDADAHWRGGAPVGDMGLGVFFDVGSAWFAQDEHDPFDRLNTLVDGGGFQEGMELAKSLGFAVALGDIRVNVARPLDASGEEWQFTLRFGRTF